jgi:hypothetical protein
LLFLDGEEIAWIPRPFYRIVQWLKLVICSKNQHCGGDDPELKQQLKNSLVRCRAVAQNMHETKKSQNDQWVESQVDLVVYQLFTLPMFFYFFIF